MEERFFKKITIRPESMNTDKFSDDTFGKALRRYIDDECIKLIDFAVYVGVNKSTLSRYIKGRYIPETKTLMRICIILHLYPERSAYLFELCGHVLGNSKLHHLYKAILADVFLNRRTIKDYNEFLKENGVDESDLL